MKDIINWTNANPGFVNAVLTFKMFLITTFYVYLTYKLVHVNFSPKVSITIYSPSRNDTKKFKAVFYNHGPNSAFSVQYSYIANNGMECLLHIPEVKEGSEKLSELDISSSLWPVYITWETATNKKEKLVYYRSSDRFVYKKIGRLYRSLFFIKKLFSKYSRIYKYFHKNKCLKGVKDRKAG